MLPVNPSVKLENSENVNEELDDNEDETEENVGYGETDGIDEDAEKLLKVNIVTEFDSLKALMTQYFRKKECDYINLELEHDATLEKLEQYEENAEEVKKQLTKNRNVIDKLKSDNEILEAQVKNFVAENGRLRLDLKTQKDRIAKSEPILKQYLNAMQDKDKEIHQLRNERKQDSRFLKEIREKDKQIELLKNEMGKLMNENMQKDLKWEKAQVTLKASVSQIKVLEDYKKELKNLELDLEKKSKNNSESILKMMELSQKLASKENEINNLKTSAANEKNKGNFFVMDKQNEENDLLSEKLEEKEEEVRRLNDENTEIVEALNTKENEIKTLESRYQNKLNDNKKLLNSLDDMMKQLKIKDKDLKNKDQDAVKMKNEFKKYFDVLSLKSTKAVDFMTKQQQRPIN